MILSYDIVLDASDNVATRYLLNDACILSQKPLVSGSALRFEGQVWHIWLYETKLVKVLADNILQEAFFKISLFVKYMREYIYIYIIWFLLYNYNDLSYYNRSLSIDFCHVIAFFP